VCECFVAPYRIVYFAFCRCSEPTFVNVNATITEHILNPINKEGGMNCQETTVLVVVSSIIQRMQRRRLHIICLSLRLNSPFLCSFTVSSLYKQQWSSYLLPDTTTLTLVRGGICDHPLTSNLCRSSLSILYQNRSEGMGIVYPVVFHASYKELLELAASDLSGNQ